MIVIKNLVKKYQSVVAVDRLNLVIPAGELFGFLGPNGAGKTTVMRMLTCFLPATSGTATVAGFDCETQPMEVRRRIGYLPENNPLYTDMRVQEYLQFAARAKGLKGEEREKAVGQAMLETGIEAKAGQLISQLSKGFRQRVGLAQALLGDPEVLVLDEPTVGLDPAQIADIRALIKSLAGRRTIILSTHILPEVSIVCDRVVIINQGRVVESDTTANLSKKVSKSNRVQVEVEGPAEQVEAYLSKMDKVLKASRKDNGEEEGVCVFEIETDKDVDVRASIAAGLVQNKWGLRELKFVGVELEDIFIRLVTNEAAGESGPATIEYASATAAAPEGEGSE